MYCRVVGFYYKVEVLSARVMAICKVIWGNNGATNSQTPLVLPPIKK